MLEPRDGRAGGPLLFVLVLALLRLGVREGLVVVLVNAALRIRQVLLLPVVTSFILVVGVVVAGPLAEQLEELGARLVAAAADGVILVGAREFVLVILLALGCLLRLPPRFEAAAAAGGGADRVWEEAAMDGLALARV